MKTILVVLLCMLLVPFAVRTQDATPVTASFKTAGNCGMCKTRIEHALDIEGVKEAHWDICEEAAKSLARKGPPAIDSLLTLVPDSRPFIRTIAINELGRMNVAKAVPGMLKAAAKDKEPLVRSASLQALTRIAQTETPDFPQIVTAMIAALSTTEEPVVRQSALEGLAALGNKATAQRREIIAALKVVESGPNPGLADKARQMLSTAGIYGR